MNTETGIRLSIFFGMLAVMALWEVLAPRRSRAVSRRRRWPSNLGIVVLNTVLVRVLLPTTAVGLAVFAQANGWGLLNLRPLSLWITVPLTVIVMDCVVYFQHVMFHAVPLFWRFHRMHHLDLDFDFTTGNRFHPGEIFLSMLIKLTVIAALGTPPLGVLIFEILLNGCAIFNHSNAFLPLRLDRVLRCFVVTPDMHRVHHSVEYDETNSNFGFNLPWWDRLFGTYRAQPRKGHREMVIGLQTIRDPVKCLSLPRMLLVPFTDHVSAYTIQFMHNKTIENKGTGRQDD
jgi:sterol desaturase/sphingolipid hydroxylase (fatty acid hydroxylase superfamily)